MPNFGNSLTTEQFASTLVAMLINKGCVRKVDAEGAWERIASKLEVEEDAGTVNFLEPPNWPETIKETS